MLISVLTRYAQAHKQLDGRGEDMFCEARNFFVDFSKVRNDNGRKERGVKRRGARGEK